MESGHEWEAKENADVSETWRKILYPTLNMGMYVSAWIGHAMQSISLISITAYFHAPWPLLASSRLRVRIFRASEGL